MSDVPPLLAGDLPELLFCASAAVGLETATQGEMAVATIAQATASEYPSQTMCREIVFADIHSHYRAGCDRLLVVGFDDEVEIPVPLPKRQFRLLRPAEGEDAPLVFPKTHRNDDASAQGIKRDGILLERVGALVEVDAGALEADCRNRRVFRNPSGYLECLVRLADRKDGIAAHLAAQRSRGAHLRISALMQCHPFPDPMLANDGGKPLAGVRKVGLQRGKRRSLLWRRVQLDRRRAHHGLSPLGDVFGSFDVATDGFRADIAGGADVIGWRPGMSIPQPLLKCWKPLKQQASRNALEHLDGVGHGSGGRHAEKQMDVVRLNLLGDHRPISFRANRIQHRSHFLGHRSRQHVDPILRAAYHMVCGLVNTIAIGDNSLHIWNPTSHVSFPATAIPPAIQIAGFLPGTL